MPSRRPDLEARWARMQEYDDDAPFGATDPAENRKINRVTWLAAGGTAVAAVVIAGGFITLANQHPSNNTRTETTAGPFIPNTTPSVSETSASPSPSKSKASPSPSESKTSAVPSPSDPTSPSNIPSPSRSTHKVELPPVETTPAAPETHTSAPESCVWPNNGGVVTVAECGTHAAYNNPDHSGEHQLGVGMQFEDACAINGMVRISYGGGQDYVDNLGYFPVSPAC